MKRAARRELAQGTTRTGSDDSRTTSFVTDRVNSRANQLRSCEPTTITSAPHSSAS